MNCKHVLIIGGTRGIGHSVAKAFAKDHIVSVIGKHMPAASDKYIPNISYWAVDLRDTRRLVRILASIISKKGALSTLMLFQRYRGGKDLWEGEIAVSLTATRNIIEYLADKFANSSERSILIASSLAGQYIAKEQPVSYHVAKAGLNQMVRFFAVSLASRGIRVNCITYGAVLKEESRKFYDEHKALSRLYKSITPLGRMAAPEDIVDAAMFFCSEKSSFVTGQNLIIDGGISLQSHETLSRELSPLRHLTIVRKVKAE